MVDLNISQHYRSDEIPFLESITDLVGRSQNEYRPILTGFLNPRQQYIANAIVNGDDSVSLKLFGGFTSAEMKRGLIYPSYFEPADKDFNIVAYSIDYPVKFAELTHGSVLGSILGSGINRDILGDIISDGTNWQFVCEQEMASYVQTQVVKIGRVKVKLIPIDLDKLVVPIDDSEEVTTTVASLRIDALVSEGFHISRHHAKHLIETGLIRLNWEEIDRPDVEAGQADIISVRGFGRIVIKEIAGKTKKDKIRIIISLINSN